MSKKDKYFRRRFGNLVGKIESYYHHFDCRFIPNLDDEALAYLLAEVKGIYMLDLNETEITNESIKLFTKLEYVTELRAKGISGLTDACAEDLNKIKGLELLHVKNTGITIDGLLKLKDQRQLKMLLFSNIDMECIHEKMLLLKSMHADCEFIIDGKTYYFEEPDTF